MSSVLMLKLMRFKRDVLVLLIMAVFSLGFIAIFSGTTKGAYKYNILIATDEKTPSYEKFMTELIKNKSYSFEEVDYDRVRADVEEGKVLAGIYFTDEHISILKTKEDVNIFVLENLVTNTLFNIQSTLSIATEITEYIRELKPIDNKTVEAIAYKDIQDSFNKRRPMIVSKRYLDSKNTNEYDNLKHTTIGMILFMSMYSMVFGIGSILEDKQYNAWNKMLISPLTKRGILGGNLIATFFIGAAQISLLFVLTKHLMGMDWGNSLQGVILVALAFIFATTSLGLVIASLVKTQAQLSTISTILLTSTSMLGGTMWPLEIVESKILLFLSNLTPQKWAVEGIEKIVMYGKGITDILPNLGVLTLMGIVFFIIGIKKI